jgi:hypothetical protein
MKRKNLFITGILLITAISFQRCNVEPEYYSQAEPSTFFDSQAKVYARFARPFAHWAGQAANIPYGRLTWMQEGTTDEIIMPNRGGDWYDDGFFVNAFYHHFSPGTESYATYGWDTYAQGVAQVYSSIEDIDKYVDFDALGFPAGTRASMLNQLNVLVAYYYLYALDHFGGVPIYKSNQEELKARATDVETFEFIEGLLKDALPTLPKRALGDRQDQIVTQGVAASLLARLYLNAEPYIRQSKYVECAKICEDLINGVYGQYALAGSYQEIWGFDNETSNEVIWAVASDPSYRGFEAGNRNYGTHYGTWAYFDNPEAMSWNGICLIPSLDIEGKSYVPGSPNPSSKFGGPFKLGSPYAKFESTDLRKKNYVYGIQNGVRGSKKYEGMFLEGKLINPLTGAACLADGSREYLKGDTIPMPDQIGQLGPDIPKYDENGNVMYDDSGNVIIDKPRYPDGRKEGAMFAEENSGVRLLKFSPTPNTADAALWKTTDIPIIRFAEIKYMLAECKWRAGGKGEAAALINEVRARYFVGGADPNPVTAANLDEWRLLDEYMIEFLNECRRRSDLIRFGKFTTEAWWDHPADGPGKEYLNRFPIPEGAFSANPKLIQNPGYN